MFPLHRRAHRADRHEHWRCAHSSVCASVSVVVAILVSLASAVALALFDKPLDRESFVPSLLAATEAGAVAQAATMLLPGEPAA